MNMEIGILIAIVGVGVTMVGVVISMMYWVRSESNSLRDEQKADRKDFLSLLRGIQKEIQDFHYRLLEIEKNRK